MTDARKSNRPIKQTLIGAGAALGLMAAVLAPQTAHADSEELQRGNLIKLLSDRYGENSVAAGIAENGGVVELLTTGDGSTWTLLITLPDGSTRVIAAGESWISVAAQPGDPV